MVKKHPLVVDAGLLLPSDIKNLLLTENWRKQTTIECGGAPTGGFAARARCPQVTAPVQAKIISQFRLYHILNKHNCGSALGILWDTIDPDIVAPRVQIRHFIL